MKIKIAKNGYYNYGGWRPKLKLNRNRQNLSIPFNLTGRMVLGALHFIVLLTTKKMLELIPKRFSFK